MIEYIVLQIVNDFTLSVECRTTHLLYLNLLNIDDRNRTYIYIVCVKADCFALGSQQ